AGEPGGAGAGRARRRGVVGTGRRRGALTTACACAAAVQRRRGSEGVDVWRSLESFVVVVSIEIANRIWREWVLIKY
ncbi:hypothetical protein, partial [Xanthomonas sacchari]|uniref:hypothetical protein n=1 Tax=Xanthomonas sacchari TaxID=56458 RepID=UPI00225E05C4